MKAFKDKKKKLANDIEFNEIVAGLFDLLNEMNKCCIIRHILNNFNFFLFLKTVRTTPEKTNEI